jgi:hypothetical protein
VIGKVDISRGAYEGLRMVLSGDSTNFLMVGLASRHLLRLPTMSNGPSKYSAVSEMMGCDSASGLPKPKEEFVELRTKKAS